MIFLWTLVAVAVLAALVGLWMNRARRIDVDLPLPADLPEQEFSHDIFASLLQDYVSTDGRIDYLEGVAGEPLMSDLKRARDYSIEYREYDWQLNSSDRGSVQIEDVRIRE